MGIGVIVNIIFYDRQRVWDQPATAESVRRVVLAEARQARVPEIAVVARHRRQRNRLHWLGLMQRIVGVGELVVHRAGGSYSDCGTCLREGLWVFGLGALYLVLFTWYFVLGTSTLRFPSTKHQVQRPKAKGPRPYSLYFSSSDFWCAWPFLYPERKAWRGLDSASDCPLSPLASSDRPRCFGCNAVSKPRR